MELMIDPNGKEKATWEDVILSTAKLLSTAELLAITDVSFMALIICLYSDLSKLKS